MHLCALSCFNHFQTSQIYNMKKCVDTCARDGRGAIEVCLSEKGALAKKRLGNNGLGVQGIELGLSLNSWRNANKKLQVHFPFFEWPRKETCWYVWWPQGAPVAPPVPVPGCGQRNAASILACMQVWSGVVCSFFSTFNVLTSIAACNLPLCQCTATVFRIFVFSISFIVPSVVLCYLVHWLTILSVAQLMMRLQRGVIFHIGWNHWGIYSRC